MRRELRNGCRIIQARTCGSHMIGLKEHRSGTGSQVSRSGRLYKGDVTDEACRLFRLFMTSHPPLHTNLFTQTSSNKPCRTAWTCPTWILVSSPPQARNLRLLRPTLPTAPVAVAWSLAPSMARG